MEKRYDKPFQRKEDRYTAKEKENDDIIFGVRAVIEAIHSGREINKLMIQKGMQKELFFELQKSGPVYPDSL